MATAVRRPLHRRSRHTQPNELGSTAPQNERQPQKGRLLANEKSPNNTDQEKTEGLAKSKDQRKPKTDGKKVLSERLVWLIALHAGALAAPFFFSWQGLLLAVLLHWITGGIGICLGYHRMLTHGSFQTYRPVKYLITWLGSLAGQGSPVDWVADHRKHHAHSDQEGDPHTPRDGKLWSHMFWVGLGLAGNDQRQYVDRYAPDLARDPVMRFFGVTFLLWHFVAGGALFWLGWLWGGAYLGWSLVIWGIFVRLVFVLHCTWFVNSASHLWGYKNYQTGDDSRNNWWVALITYGEGWHNNHHAYPRMARHGHRWWEIDPTFIMIRLMERVGLAWNVVDYRHKNERQRDPKAAA